MHIHVCIHCYCYIVIIIGEEYRERGNGFEGKGMRRDIWEFSKNEKCCGSNTGSKINNIINK